LKRQRVDCRWRAAFRVTGSFVIADKTNQILSRSFGLFIAAMRDALGKLTGVPSFYIDVDVIKQTRRLRGRSLVAANRLLLTYAIAVSGDAPETIQVTGDQVAEKLNVTNSENIEHVVSTSIQNDMGITTSYISIAAIANPDVFEEPVPMFPNATSPTPVPPTRAPGTPIPPTSLPVTFLSWTTPTPLSSALPTPTPPVPAPPTPRHPTPEPATVTSQPRQTVLMSDVNKWSGEYVLAFAALLATAALR